MTSQKNADRASVQSIVLHPWEFACQWYGIDEIHRAINREQKLKQVGNAPGVPTDVTSREFAEWLAEQYRLAMRKGAELATSEMIESRPTDSADDKVLSVFIKAANAMNENGLTESEKLRVVKALRILIDIE